MERQLSREEMERQKHLNMCYDNLNAYDLVLRYVASQRPRNGELKATAVDGFRIHTLKPSFQDPEDSAGVVTYLQAEKLFNKPLPLPKPDPADAADMKALWPSLITGINDNGFHRHEAKKHMKFSKLKPLSACFTKGLKHGKRYITENGDLNLMNILKRKGYKVGNFYPCQQLLDDIETSTGKGVKIDFGRIPPINGQVLEDVRCLNEVCLLYDSEAENRVIKSRPQSFDPNSVFLLEDLEYRFS